VFFVNTGPDSDQPFDVGYNPAEDVDIGPDADEPVRRVLDELRQIQPGTVANLEWFVGNLIAHHVVPFAAHLDELSARDRRALLYLLAARLEAVVRSLHTASKSLPEGGRD
jgi:hypothetical protein